MAKSKKNNKKKKNSKAKKKSLSFSAWTLILISIITAMVFFSSTVLLIVGLLPTMMAAVYVSDGQKNKVLTIGALNFAGCFPFLMMIWTATDRMGKALELLSDPVTTVVMYSAAAAGYILNFGVTKVVKNVMILGANKKIQSLEKEKETLEERWGREVRGDLVLDENGFASEKELADLSLDKVDTEDESKDKNKK